MLVVVAFTVTETTFAKSVFDITYPVTELGSCDSREACKTYCDDPANIDSCIAFAKAYNIESRPKTEQVKQVPEVGPGGCAGREECREYCDNTANREECFRFGKEHGLITEEQEKKFEQQSKIEEVLKNGGGPGGCTSPDACKTYCSDSANLKECVTFGKENGLLSPEEAIRMEKQGFRAVMNDDEERGPRMGKFDENFEGPGDCKGPDKCRKYCDDPANQETCISYAEEHGFMTKAEAERTRMMVNKTGPGGCRGEECRKYCDDPANREECITYAEENGFMSKEEVTRARKMQKIEEQGGPGGCKGPEECRAYCADQEAHGEECFRFGKEHNLIDEDHAQRFEEGKVLRLKLQENGGPGGCTSPEACHEYCSDTAHVAECNDFSVKHGAISPEEAKKRLENFSKRAPGFDEQGRPREGGPNDPRMMRPQNGQFMPRQDNGEYRRDDERFVGPGGCTSREECEKVCDVNPEKCKGSDGRPPMPMVEGKPMMFDGERDVNGEHSKPREGMYPPDGRMPVDGKMLPPKSQGDQSRMPNADVMKVDAQGRQINDMRRFDGQQGKEMMPSPPDSHLPPRPPATVPYRSPEGIFSDQKSFQPPVSGEFQNDQMNGDMSPRQEMMPEGTFKPTPDAFIPPPPVIQ